MYISSLICTLFDPIAINSHMRFWWFIQTVKDFTKKALPVERQGLGKMGFMVNQIQTVGLTTVGQKGIRQHLNP